MKRFLLIILVIGTLFSIVACSTGNKDATIDKPTPIQPPAINAETGEPISSEPAEPWLPFLPNNK